MNLERYPVQFAIHVPQEYDEHGVMYVVGNDGTMWARSLRNGSEWLRIMDLPQPPDDAHRP
jgi:hypothetical protein